MATVKIDVSNTLDAPDVKALKNSLMEYSRIITGSTIFNENNNVPELTELIYKFLEDLYIKEPEEVINFINQKPSKKLIENIFKQFGISEKIIRNFPDLLKTKTAYMLSQLFEAKGSNRVFEFFNEVISEFYHKLNFYNVRIEQREFISKYESPVVQSVFYLDADQTIADKYDMPIQDAGNLIDPDIEFEVFTTINYRYNEVKYLVKFFLDQNNTNTATTSLPIRLKLNYTDYVIIPSGVSEYEITVKKFDIYDLTARNENELVYKLEPVLINDPLTIIDEISPTDLRTSKYLMNRVDFFNTDTRNSAPTNVFPIVTNVLYIQFSTSETMDTMEYHPDLVRMFAMTTTQDDVFSFSIDGTTIKISMQEYINLLTYIKFRELEFNNPGWSWTNNIGIGVDYSSMIYPKSRLEEIYNLILFYRDMRHDHDAFNEFKRRYNILVGDSNQLRNTKIQNMTEFSEYLAGNIPATFTEFFDMMEGFYPDGVEIISGKDQNKLMKEKVYFIYETYNPETPRDLFNIIALQDEEYLGLNNSVYDMLKLQFIDKYPRIVQKIDAIADSTEFLELYLNNYKRMLVEVVKMDNFVTYFVNDTFKRFLLASSFKDEFFDPVMDLFQQYFFKAELSYQNSDTLIHINRDKMQQVTCGTKEYYGVELEGYFSELNLSDRKVIRHTQTASDLLGKQDAWLVEITNDVTGVSTFDEATDAEYVDGNKL